eukprot:CAMPEP_0119102500 /NCGR_PEP_ID=MMETSP1180-20130426/1227_1 /TAXON_ID=3052 ORGANISM="Chlamydomonas cf sp, Strain CCMP681" /NCGR_SAMPLE_ID=MMETSP1180 /ASSEMBLY_ACC=CAM_ASM_000741 /LENGTH=112 /DNA_ID=CAMNT_0007086801 /DNA_START=40 /DNA_END=378 /DNA_ORIENTATION=-
MRMNVVDINSTDEWKAQMTAAGAKPVLVDFYADWCGPCKMIAPKFAELATANAGTMVFLKVNVDVCEEIAASIANITAMPTFQVWQNGSLIETLVGASLDKLNAMVLKHASS